MSFKEDFPSLKGKHTMEGHIQMFPYFIIKTCCLDKQKVREAIEKHKRCYTQNNMHIIDGVQGISCFDAILKELGLKGE